METAMQHEQVLKIKGKGLKELALRARGKAS
jgi:hypothetical protein